MFIKKYWPILIICLSVVVVLSFGYMYIKLLALPIKLIKCEPEPYNNNCWISARFMDLNDCKAAINSLDEYYTYSCAKYVEY